MNASSPVSLALLAAVLLCGPALAQTITRPNPPVVIANADRHCTSTELSTDALAPCSDDTLTSSTGVMPAVVRPPDKIPTESSSTSAATGTQQGTGTQQNPSSTGTVTTGTQQSTGTQQNPGSTGTVTTGTTGAGSAATSMGTTGVGRSAR